MWYLKLISILHAFSQIQCETNAFISTINGDGNSNQQNSIIVMGITGDLSRKTVMPALWSLYRREILPPSTSIIGFGRSKKTVQQIRDSVTPNVELLDQADRDKYDLFWKNVFYAQGFYDKVDTYKDMLTQLQALEKCKSIANRLYYLALPPNIYASAATAIHDAEMEKREPSGWTRLIFEKPFGRDLESSDELSNHLSKLFSEDQIYRIDHYLGKEMVQNILPFRFANVHLLEPMWNRDHIANVEILFKESFGTKGRGGYFDSFGIIRDVVQNHLLQVVTLVAMEMPKSASSKDIRDEKMKLLQAMETLSIEDVVIGQYVGNPNGEGESKYGYLDEPDVPKNSTASTYSLTVMHINNTRWSGVPFLITAGKALDESRVEVRIQLKDVENDIFGESSGKKTERNMIILRIQPNEAIYQNVNIKQPGFSNSLMQSQIELVYGNSFQDVYAYEQLIPDVFTSTQNNFVRSDELREAWRIFNTVLHQIDDEKIRPINYVFGSLGPDEAEVKRVKYGRV